MSSPFTTFGAVKHLLGATVTDLSRYLDVPVNTVKAYLGDEIAVPLDVMDKMMDLLYKLDVRADDLADEIERSPNSQYVEVVLPASSEEAARQGLYFLGFVINSSLIAASRANVFIKLVKLDQVATSTYVGN